MSSKYHGESHNKIQEAFIELYAKEPFSKISVKNVCEKANISRTTFYNHYQDLYAVLEEIEDKLVSELKAINQSFYVADFKKYRDGESFDYFYDTLLFIKKHSKYFKTLLSIGKGGQFIYKWKKIIKADFKKKYEREQIQIKNVELVLEMIASAVIGAYTYWLFNLDIISIKDLADEVLYKLCQDFIR